jgi:hypothetical protein
MTRTLSLLVALLLWQTALSAGTPTDSERAAIFTAAGFKANGDQYFRCEEDPPTLSYMAGSIEMADLNGDGRDEAWVREGSTFCYGNTAEFFVLLTRNTDGGWTRLLEDAGIAVVRSTQHHGWPDIEVGGPGAGPFPVYRFDGTQYRRTE